MFELFAIVGTLIICGAIITFTTCFCIGVGRGKKKAELAQQNVVLPDEVPLMDCREEVQRVQTDAFDLYRNVHKAGIPSGVVDGEYFSGPSLWLERYIRFLRYIDCKILIVQRRHFDGLQAMSKDLQKHNVSNFKYNGFKDMGRNATLLLIVVLTSPVVAYFVTTGFSKPYIYAACKWLGILKESAPIAALQ